MILISKMSDQLNIHLDYISNIAKNSRKYYKVYKIKKHSGGFRLVYHPSPKLKVFQYWLVNNFFKKFSISPFATAYSTGNSIKKNAIKHKDSNHIFHTDIINFFESIKEYHIISLFDENKDILKNLGVDNDDIDIILNLVLYDGHLVIGSVSAPIISNLIMFNFDLEISKAIPDTLIYTRYADDMIFSSNNFINNEIIKLIESILKKLNMKINRGKTYFMSNKGRKVVTGLIINHERKVSIGFRNHEKIKRMLYNKLEHKIGDANVILGHLFFLKDIEPGYFNKLMVKYSTYGNVMDILKEDRNKNLNRSKVTHEAALTNED